MIGGIDTCSDENLSDLEYVDDVVQPNKNPVNF